MMLPVRGRRCHTEAFRAPGQRGKSDAGNNPQPCSNQLGRVWVLREGREARLGGCWVLGVLPMQVPARAHPLGCAFFTMPWGLSPEHPCAPQGQGLQVKIVPLGSCSRAAGALSLSFLHPSCSQSKLPGAGGRAQPLAAAAEGSSGQQGARSGPVEQPRAPPRLPPPLP